MSDDRPVFVLVLRPEKSVADPVRALRALIKIALRRYGLRLIEIKERQPDDIAA